MIVFVCMEELFGLRQEPHVSDSSLVGILSGWGGSIFGGHKEDDRISSVGGFYEMVSSETHGTSMGECGGFRKLVWVLNGGKLTAHHQEPEEWFTWP